MPEAERSDPQRGLRMTWEQVPLGRMSCRNGRWTAYHIHVRVDEFIALYGNKVTAPAPAIAD